MSRSAANSSADTDYEGWDDPALWSASSAARRFSFGGREPRDIVLSIAIVVLPLVLLFVVLALAGVGDGGAAGGGSALGV